MSVRPKKGTPAEHSWRSLPLWAHQICAVELIEKYLKDKSRGAALIHMPTGTGKTGIIAAVCCGLQNSPNSLVLTPWRALQSQMADDLSVGFWKTIKRDPTSWAHPTLTFTPSNLTRILKRLGRRPGIIVGTFQGLRWLYERDPRTYNELRRRISLVVVDEGHYEPAPEWGDAVRHLARPTVLLTATPYRNDLKLFSIDPEYIYSFSFHQAVKDGYIRSVIFRDINTETPNSFVDDLLRFFQGEFRRIRTGHSSSPKAIVRCQNIEEIKTISALIAAQGKSVVAIHDRFKPGVDLTYCVNTVPDPRTSPFTFWVHQFKLMEGVDEPDFEILAVYKPLRSARAFVQQVGRIIRNPGLQPRRTAFVLASLASHQEEYWTNYMEFEKSAENADYFKSLLDVPIHKRIFDAQKGIWYVNGNFRSMLKPEVSNIERELLFRVSTLILRVTSSFDFKTLCNEAIDLAKERDREIVGKANPAAKTWLYVYVDFENSPLLHSKAFIECRLGYSFFRQIDDLLFCFDSQGLLPDFLAETTLPLVPATLQRLFPRGDRTRLFEVSLVNTDLGRHAVRARTIRAHSIADTAPSITDYAHFCSTALGYAQLSAMKGVRRYLGITRGRVTDTQIPFRFENYMRWLDGLAVQIRSESIQPDELFMRYAQFAEVPINPDPRNILLDLTDVMGNYLTIPARDVNQQPLECADLCFKIKKGRFSFIANGHRYPVTVKFEVGTGRYVLNSPMLEAKYVNTVDEKSIINYLNQTQSFRIVPKTRRYIYAHRHWFLPNLHVARAAERLLKIFSPIRILSKISSEKGKTCGAAVGGWEEGSLFGLIDRLGTGTEMAADMDGINMLVCDDMRAEAADFIAADTKNPRVIFIHAKAFSKPKKRSASSFQEVCGQAVKNLELLHPYSARTPPNLKMWDGSWEVPGINGKIPHRIRRGGKNPSAFWMTVQELIQDPTTIRSVWIVLGQGFSLGDFRERIEKKTERPEDVQIIYQVQSTWNAVASIGAQLQIFCSE